MYVTHVVGIAKLLEAFYSILEESGPFLASDKRETLRDLARTMKMLYLQLSSEALTAERRFWKATAKWHPFEHACSDQLLLGNPRMFWTYGDEDLMQFIKKIAVSCHPRTRVPTTLHKWVITFDLDESEA